MTTFYEAKGTIQPKLINQIEEVGLLDSINRVLAVDIVSDIDFPPFNKATMDGFAFKFSDVDDTLKLKIADELFAGSNKDIKLKPKDAVRIMTGAKVPDCCDSVVELEAVTEQEGYIIFKNAPKKGSNIAYFGEDLKKGETVLKKGTLIKTNMVNLLAQLSCATIKVYRKLKIGVITTGDELINLGEPQKPSSVIDTSRYSLIAQINQFNQEAVDYGKLPDDLKIIEQTLDIATKTCDIVVITGGSSFGDKDYTADALNNISAKILVRTIDMKPGRPTIIALKDNCYIVGSPGNPVSTFSVFRLFVGNIISKILGCSDFDVSFLKCSIAFDYNKKPDRMHFLPVDVRFEQNIYKAYKIPYNGSGDFSALSKANAFLAVPKEIQSARSGDVFEFFFS
ncbi:MAG: molybdopterin molybdotransferase MoeA [Desulfurella sp.]|jgi:molybdopterin molybdotransferase